MRIGAVSYLNTKPLIHGFDQRLPEAELVLDLPSRLADRLATGDLDVALIPSFEAFRGSGYHIVSDACIGCRGPVWSVKLLSNVDPERIETLSLDEGSRTSAALVRLWLDQVASVRPRLVPWSIDRPLASVDTDAVLIIGDRAMRDRFDGWRYQWDLGELWYRWTGLPFVFACWVARRGDDGRLAEALESMRDRGLAELASIAEREGAKHGLSNERCLAYLRDDLHFHLHDEQIEGLRRFRRMAIDAGLAPAGNELTCHGCALA